MTKTNELAGYTWDRLREMNHAARMALDWEREEAIHQELMRRHREADAKR